jgi:hypothetical protein
MSSTARSGPIPMSPRRTSARAPCLAGRRGRVRRSRIGSAGDGSVPGSGAGGITFPQHSGQLPRASRPRSSPGRGSSRPQVRHFSICRRFDAGGAGGDVPPRTSPAFAAASFSRRLTARFRAAARTRSTGVAVWLSPADGAGLGLCEGVVTASGEFRRGRSLPVAGARRPARPSGRIRNIAQNRSGQRATPTNWWRGWGLRSNKISARRAIARAWIM